MAKYCEEIVRQVEGLLVLGLSNERACEAVGIHRDTFYDWVNKTPFTIWECNCKIIIEKGEGGPVRVARTWETELPEKHYCLKCKSELEEKPNFSDRTKRAKTTGQAQLLNIIRKAAPDTWTAAAWMLERIWPKEFGKNDRIKLEHSGPDGGPIQTKGTLITGEMTSEQAQQAYNAMIQEDKS